MARYRKKPIVLEAYQFFKKNKNHPGVYWNKGVKKYVCFTFNGPVIVVDGDWIINSNYGESYPVRDTIFKLTYDLWR